MLKTIPINQVRMGMHIHALKGAWIDHPFWKTKFVLSDPSDLEKLRTSIIKEVVIDTNLGLDVAPISQIETMAESKPNQQPELSNKPIRAVTISEERIEAAKIINSASQVIAAMHKDVRLGKMIDSGSVLPLVSEISESVARNTHALISLVRLKTLDDCTYLHSIAVCALMTALAKSLNLSDGEVRQAALAGLMHDMGKAKVPLEILNKPGSLTDAEFEIIKKHPQWGVDLLIGSGIHDEAAHDVCLHHHEKVDGSGYPHGLRSEQISVVAKMGAICDVYDAVTSLRPYKTPWEPGIALQRMASWNGHFDPAIFKAFVKSIGIYPVGTVVLLKSGRLAVVTRQSEKGLLAPVVKTFFSTKSKLYIQPVEIDLSKSGQDEITSNETLETWGIKNVDRLWLNV